MNFIVKKYLDYGHIREIVGFYVDRSGPSGSLFNLDYHGMAFSEDKI